VKTKAMADDQIQKSVPVNRNASKLL